MRTRIQGFVVVPGAMLLLVAASLAWGEIRGESRQAATHVVTGTVRSVHVREANGYRDYIVEVTVEQVTRGQGLKTGDAFQVSCFKRMQTSSPPVPGPSGHRIVPTEGQRVRVFAIQRGGRAVGVYPDWVDILPGGKN